MSVQENIQLVKQGFAALGQGNIKAVLDTFAEEVDFRSPVSRTQPPEISWAKPRHNREEVAAFFREMNEKMQPECMEVSEITAQDNRVVVEGRNRGTVRSTGNPYEHDWVMIFDIRDGKIVRNWHYYDTADLVAAFHKD